MANETDIIVRIKAEGADKFAKALKDAGVQVEKVGDEVKKTEKKTTSSFKKIGAAVGAAFATQQLIQFGKQLVKLAIDVEATEAKFKTVFGNASKIVEDFAKKNANSLGLTTSEFKKAAAAAGDLLIPMGFNREEAAKLSSGLVKLSGALSAWSGGQFDASQTSEILTKALLGEREQLKTLGVSITEADVKARLLSKGQAKLTGTTLEQAKATATYELILEKTVDAQAAFSDDTKTLAERQLVAQAQFKELGETLAQEVIPIYEDLLETVSSKEFQSFTQLVVGVLAGTIKFAGKAAEGWGLVAIKVGEALGITEDYSKLTFDEAVKRRNAISDEINVLRDQIAVYDELTEQGVAYDDTQEFNQRIRLKNLKEEIKQFNELIKSFKSGARITKTVTQTVEETTEVVEEQADAVVLFTNAWQKFESAYISVAGTVNDVTLFEDLPERLEELGQLALNVGLQLAMGLSAAVPEAVDDIEEVAKTAEEIQNARIQKAQDAFRVVSDFERQGLQFFNSVQTARLQILDNKLAQGLISEKEYEEERKKLQEKSAKASKAQAIFDTTINTAAAVINAIKGPVPFPANLALAALAGALGAAQIAAIAATPIPKFAKGTRKVGDGYEMGEDRTLAWLNSGERVVTTEDNKKHWKMLNALEDGDTDAMIKALAGYGVAVQFQADDLMDKLNTPLKSLKDIKANDKKVRLDLNPLLNASDRQRMTLGRKLDKIHEVLSKQSTHRMTRA